MFLKNSFIFILSLDLIFLGTGAILLVCYSVSKVIHELDPAGWLISGWEYFASSSKEVGIRLALLCPASCTGVGYADAAEEAPTLGSLQWLLG